MFKKKDYWFDLPDELIAQYPSEKRDHSRLLVINRKNDTFINSHFYNLIDFLNPGDCLVINNTKVIPARLNTIKIGTGAKIEVLLLKPLKANQWQALINPAKKIHSNTRLAIGKAEIKIIDRNSDSSFIIEFQYDGNLDEFIDQHGNEPLPPYIKRESELTDKERYQTVYAKTKGAVAAPTAGLHFTNEIISEIKKHNIQIVPVTLHVGLGTFRPVKTDEIQAHKMHSESYSISETTAETINKIKSEKSGRIIAVGTTSLRCLEASAENGTIQSGSNQTDIFIYPGYRFKCIDALITNFHTPESTLLMLVSAFAGFEKIKSAYQHAIENRYRFFSYGDSMLIQ